MLLGMSFGTEAGLAASLVHVFNHGLMKAALFMAVACVVLRLGAHTVDAFEGLAKRMPWTAGAFVFSGLSLVGVPLTVGFISKWYLLTAAFNAGHAWAGFLIVASSLVAVVYIGRIIELILLKPVPTEGRFAGDVKEAPLSMLIPMYILVFANFYFGVRTGLTGGLAEKAAASLMGAL